ncbi:MAG: S41 family peptidase [Bacteroidota bacterium]
MASKTYNWDSVLVAALPRDSSLMDVARSQQVVDRLLAVAGPVPDCQVCPPEFDSAQAFNADWAWMERNTLLRSDQMLQLQRIRDQREPWENRYIQTWLPSNYWNLDQFVMDSSYDSTEYFDYRHRLLTLFHYWNVIQYFFPYRHRANPDWDQTLLAGVTRFIAAASKYDFHLAMTWVANQINDSHANASGSRYIAESWFGTYMLPFRLRLIQDSQVVVSEIWVDSLMQGRDIQLGDQVIEVDGRDVWEVIRDDSAYIAASNEWRRLFFSLSYLSADTQKEAMLTMVREDSAFEAKIKRISTSASISAPALEPWAWLDEKDASGILRANLGSFHSNGEARRFLRNARKARAVILDARDMALPDMPLMQKIANEFSPPEVSFLYRDTLFASYFLSSYEYPGYLTTYDPDPRLNDKRNQMQAPYYRRPVVLIVGPKLQSKAEKVVMYLQTNPNSYTIGEPTSGALGAVGKILMPGGFYAAFTQHGMTYADGTPIFGRGVKLNETVLPTQVDIQAGRDPVLERAIEYLNEQP